MGFTVLNDEYDSAKGNHIITKYAFEKIEDAEENKEEYERFNMSDEIIDYVDRFFKDIDKKYNIERIEDKKRLIKKYIDSISVKRLGKNENKRDGFELNIKLNLKDENSLINEEENNLSNKKNDYKIYISNINNMEVWRL